MSTSKDIFSELNAISPAVAEIKALPVFTVPEGYFDDFPSKMMELVKKNDRSELDAELESISPFLAGLEKKNPFTVPEGYFSSVKVPMEVLEPKTAKIVSFNSRARFRTLMAAASIVAVLGVGIWLFQMNPKPAAKINDTTLNINSELPKLSANEITNYLDSLPEEINLDPISLAGVEEIDLDKVMENINEAELEQFIKENPGFTEKNMN